MQADANMSRMTPISASCEAVKDRPLTQRERDRSSRRRADSQPSAAAAVRGDHSEGKRKYERRGMVAISAVSCIRVSSRGGSRAGALEWQSPGMRRDQLVNGIRTTQVPGAYERTGGGDSAAAWTVPTDARGLGSREQRMVATHCVENQPL